MHNASVGIIYIVHTDVKIFETFTNLNKLDKPMVNRHSNSLFDEHTYIHVHTL